MPNKELMNKIIAKRKLREEEIKKIEDEGFEMRDGTYVHSDGRTKTPPWKKSHDS